LLGAPAVVDIRSSDPSVGTGLAARLAAAGVQVGAVAGTDATVSAVQYPVGQSAPAGVLAAALGLSGSEQAAVGHVTVVVAAGDAGRLAAGGPIC
jgi:hypothetical protein